MNTQFKKGIIELCVLKIVSNKDMYGFEVIENISREIEVNENTIYPILRRLTKQGFFETYTESMSIGAPRKYYKLTEIGTKETMSRLAELEEFIKTMQSIVNPKLA